MLFIHWVCLLTAQGFLASLIISGCVHQLPKFLLWVLSLLTTPLSLQGVSANHPITWSGCVATSHSHCSPREHQVSIVITTDDNPDDQAFAWPSECQNMLLDPGIVNDTQTQALLLTTLVRALGFRLFISTNSSAVLLKSSCKYEPADEVVNEQNKCEIHKMSFFLGRWHEKM